MANRYRKFLLTLLMLSLTGCSSTTFVYNRLDFIIPWYLGKYVDLDRTQKKSLDQLLDPFLAWHRSDELPTYLQVVGEMQQILDGEVSAAQVEAIALQFEQAWLRIEARSLEWMISLGEELSREQMEEFIDKLREKQAEYEEEYLSRSEDEFREETYDNLKDSVQDYLGRLDWGQRSILEEASEQLKRSDAIWLRERALWLDRMENILQREEGWQQALRDALADREQTTSPEYKEVYQHNAQVLYAAIANVLNSRSEQQDRRLRKKLEDLREDIETLME